jgi:hypothetical protein
MPLLNNSMAAPIKEKMATCSMCDHGKILMDDPKEFRRWLNHKIFNEKLTSDEIRLIKNEWKQSGKVDCENCRSSSGQVLVME